MRGKAATSSIPESTGAASGAGVAMAGMLPLLVVGSLATMPVGQQCQDLGKGEAMEKEKIRLLKRQEALSARHV